MKKSIEELVESIALPIIQNEKFELIDIEYVLEGGHRYLRVFIDKENGINLNDCKIISEALTEKLDISDPIKENYFLEVSSPGLDRALKKEKDFIRYAGRDVELKLYKPVNNKKEFEGSLVGLNDGIISIKSNDEVIEFNKKDVSIIRLAVKF